jgi:hypothetical protein
MPSRHKKYDQEETEASLRIMDNEEPKFRTEARRQVEEDKG